MLSAVAVGGLVLSLLGSLIPAAPAGPVGTAAAEPPPPGQVTIALVKVNGSGCKPRTAAVAISPDREAFTVTYSEYLVQAGPGSKPADAAKDCQLTVRLDIPAGYTYAVAHADHRGFAQLTGGASGMHRARYRVQSEPKPAFVEHPFGGPFDDNWLRTDVIDPAHRSWAACGKSRKLDIDTDLRVRADPARPQETNVMGMDSTDGSVDTRYHLAWRRCSG